jgi:SecY
MMRDPFARIVVTTLALLAAYRVGNFIPLTGIDLQVLSGQGGGSAERFSVNALGIVPWLSALTLIELAALVLPERVSARFTRHGHARPFSLEVIVLALVLATIQGIGVSHAFMQVPRLVIDPGHWFTLTTSVTLATGTVLTIAVARLVERHGIGYGFWIMLAAWSISVIAPHARQLYAMLSQGAASLPLGLAALASDVAIIMAVIGLLQARRAAGFTKAEPVLWPLALAPLVSGWLVGLAAFIAQPNVARGVLHWMIPNNPMGFMVHAAIVSIFVIRYAGREGSRAFVAPAIAMMIGATLVSQITWTMFGIQPLLGGASAVIVATVLYAVIQRAAPLVHAFGPDNENV